MEKLKPTMSIIDEIKKDHYRWIYYMFEVLNELHIHNFYHTDLSSGNIMGKKFIDFGYHPAVGTKFFTGDQNDTLEQKDISALAKYLIFLVYILITFKNEVKIMSNCMIINAMFIQNDTLWVYRSISRRP